MTQTSPGQSCEPDPREPLGRVVHQTRRDFEAERSALKDRPGFLMHPWEERHWEQRELDMRMGAAVAAAVLEPFNAALPEGAQQPVTPELLTALGALWEKFWNETGTLEGDTPGYSLISYEDVNTLDEAAQAVEALLYPPSPDEGEGSGEGEAP
jgi:hypothetical protein